MFKKAIKIDINNPNIPKIEVAFKSHVNIFMAS